MIDYYSSSSSSPLHVLWLLQAPFYESLAKTYPFVTFTKCDVDECKPVAQTYRIVRIISLSISFFLHLKHRLFIRVPVTHPMISQPSFFLVVCNAYVCLHQGITNLTRGQRSQSSRVSFFFFFVSRDSRSDSRLSSSIFFASIVLKQQ